MPLTKEFKELVESTKHQYLGKKVPKKYQNKYGRVYDLNETKSIAYAIAKSKGIKIDRTRGGE